jgi:translocator protein
MDWPGVYKLIISLVACFAAAGIGSLFTFKAVSSWYPGLRKPPYTPPNRVFGPVWTILYFLMGMAVFIIWQKGLTAPGVLLAFVLFWIQLGVNAFWSAVFFGMKSKGGGAIVIIILWLLILAAIISFFRISGWAGALLIPYILWVSIATYLNIGVWRLNRLPGG